MASPHPLSETVKALTFDVFGTCVDWRTPIVAALTAAAEAKLASPSFALLPAETQSRLRSVTARTRQEQQQPQQQPQKQQKQKDDDTDAAGSGGWSRFADQWRASYGDFTRAFVPGTTAWKDVDAHHRDSLAELLDRWGLAEAYGGAELDGLARAWHFLAAWPDSAEGLRRLGGKSGRFETASLSNGNTALLRDLAAHAGLGFGRLLSAEDFRAYKPHPSLYRGACAALGCEPGEVAMVAAHLGDLAAARAVGMRTVYVERPGEEEWAPDDERHIQAREWVDMWVAEDEGGFIELARRLGA